MKKRIISLLACGVVAAGATVGMTACKGDRGLTVWAPQTQQTLVKELVEEFKTANPDIKLKINVGVCGESEAYANLSKDGEAGADVYGFANDQLMNLKKAGVIARIGNTVVENLKKENDANSVEAGKIVESGEDRYYGYPYAADNGFFMYYDSTIISSEQAKTLEGVLEGCAAANKYFLFNMKDSWYVGSFFYGAGGDYTIKWDGTAIEEAKCDFDQKAEGTEYTYGQIAGTALMDLRANACFVNGTDTEIQQYANSNRLGAVVTGTWNANFLQEKLGEGYAATKLPTYRSSLTGEDYQLIPFAGYKLFGVNAQSKHIPEAHRLAAFLSGEHAQQKRFELGIGPSNLKVAASDAVKANVALAALASQLSFAKIQESLPSNYWSSLDAFGTDIYGKIKPEDLDAKLTALISGLND